MIRLDLYLHDVIVLSNVRQSASYRGSFASVALRVQHVPLRIQRREESEQSYVSEIKRSGRRVRGKRGLGERRLH